MTIPVVYASDDKGRDQLLVSLYSLLRNKNPETNYDIYVCSKDIQYPLKADAKKIIDKFPGSSIQFVDFSEYEKKYDLSNIVVGDELRNSKWPSPTWYRLFLPIIIKNYKKAIYLDIDTLILKDLSDLYNYDVKGYAAGVENYPMAGWIRWVNESLRTGNDPEFDMKWTARHFDDKSNNYDHYMQSGMLLVNLERWTPELVEQMLNTAKELHINDEDIINYTFKTDLDLLPVKYNFCLHFFNNENDEFFREYFNKDISEFDNMLNEAYIIHYSFRTGKPNFILNYTSVYLALKFSDYQDFSNILHDFNTYSYVYDINSDKLSAQRLKIMSDAFLKIINSSKVTGCIEKTFEKWFKTAIELYSKIDISRNK